MTGTNHRRDGDAPRSDKAYDRWAGEIVRALGNIETYQSEIQEGRPTLVSFRIKCDPDDEKGVLLIAKGYQGSQAFVAFHGDVTVTSAIVGFGNRLANGSLKWREETPYGG